MGASILWIAVALVLLPVAIFVGLIWLLRSIYMAYRDSPARRRERALRRAHELYDQVSMLIVTDTSVPAGDPFTGSILEDLVNGLSRKFPTYQLFSKFADATNAIYVDEGFVGDMAPPPADGTSPDLARYCDAASALVSKLSNPHTTEVAHTALTDSFLGLCARLPPLAFQPEVEVRAYLEAGRRTPAFTVKLLDVVPDVAAAIEELVAPFYSQSARSLGLFSSLRAQLDRNQHEMSGVPYSPEYYQSPKLVMPTDYKGAPDEIVRGYLRHTPLENLFLTHVPFEIPEAARYEHAWIIAGSGHGKTQTLQHLIADDLQRVATGNASVVVIDSQGDLIKNTSGLKIFAEGQRLAGKLCLIDPTDIEYPVALNLFDVGMERIAGYDPLERERLMNGIMELYDFVLSSLLSAELTQKQSVIFRYIVRLMLHIPGATIHTFREIMEPRGYEKYRQYIDKLDGTARMFFETEFNSKQFEDTKRQVARRLWGVLENRTFERMFSHPKNKLDLFVEMNAGKVILINTAKELLKQNGTELLGRFFIALIAQAAQERAAIRTENRMPTFVYVDECADYLDQNVSLILEQARKFNVGMILAHQYVGQLSPKLQESFAANTSIKFAGGVSDRDARTLAHMLRCEPQFIERQPKGHFAALVRNFTSSAVSLRVPFGRLEAMQRMTSNEFREMRTRMRAQYAVPWTDVDRGNTEQTGTEAASKGRVINPDAVSTAPATKW